MIDSLKSIEKDLPVLLDNWGIWKTLDVDYFPPRVERVWCQYDEHHRLFIHLIHGTEEACLFHKHRWPAAFKIIDGEYEMGLAYTEKEITSEEAYKLPHSKFIMVKGSYYDMTNTHMAHYVKPIGKSLSLMLTGPMYKEAEFRKEILTKELKPLSDDRKRTIIEHTKKLLT